jgi:hypothetical protein
LFICHLPIINMFTRAFALAVALLCGLAAFADGASPVRFVYQVCGMPQASSFRINGNK